MILLWLIAFQAAAELPDLQLNANVRARSVTVEKQGNAHLTVTTSPDGGNLVDVRAPKANGRKTLRDVNVSIRAEARVGDPLTRRDETKAKLETAPPQ